MHAEIDPAGAGGQEGWYVYGVVLANTDEPEAADADRGHHHATRLVEGEVAAVATRVPLSEFGEDPLHERLSDLGWVEAVALAHQAVLDELVARVTVLPMRMCTVYRTETSLRGWLRRESTALKQAIGELEHKAEWGVKVFVNPGDASEVHAGAGASDQDGPEAGPGVAYIGRLRAERAERARSRALVQHAVEQIHDQLRLISSEALVIPAHRPEVSGHPGEMVLNGVYLVPDAASEHFHAAVDELQAAFGSTRIELETTGPWPPYNFVPGRIGASS